MIQSLLEERFKLRAHRETRSHDGYALVRVSNDRLGPSMQHSSLNCRDPKAAKPRTGISGTFDVELKWAPGLEPSDLPSIFTECWSSSGSGCSARRCRPRGS